MRKDTITLGDLISLQRGHDLPEQNRRPGTVPVVGSAGITGYHDTAKAKGPGVTVGRSGASFGKVFFIKEDYWPHNAALYVTDFKGNDPYFVRYLLESLDFSNLNSGSAQQSLNRNFVYPVSVPKFSHFEQRRIASILFAYDDLIENNTRRIAILEEMARRIYEEWFVRFRFPGHEQVRMVESELGLIPKGWRVGRLDDAIVLQRGFDLPSKDRQPGEYPVIAATGVHGAHTEGKVKGPGVVTGRSGSLGTVLYIHEDHWPLNTTLWVKEFRHATPLFAYYLLKGLDFAGLNAGAAVPTLNRNDVHAIRVSLPPDTLLSAFDNIVQPVFNLLRTLTQKNVNLRTTRDLLLPKLISGELDVSHLSEPEAMAA